LILLCDIDELASEHVCSKTVLVHDGLILKDEEQEFIAWQLLIHDRVIEHLETTDIQLIVCCAIHTERLDLELILKLTIAQVGLRLQKRVLVALSAISFGSIVFTP
jgi:hypothetical protein